MAEVFISYRNTPERRVLVKRLALMLRAHEVTVWWDYGLEAGESYRSQIVDELSKALIVAPLWCEESVKSKWVIMEAELGKDKLVPARLQNVTPPEAFEAIQSADLIDWNGAGDHPRALAFVRNVRERLGKRSAALVDMLEELQGLRLLAPLPKILTSLTPPAHVKQSNAALDDLRRTWERLHGSKEIGEIERFLGWVQSNAKGSGIEFEVENALLKIRTEGKANALATGPSEPGDNTSSTPYKSEAATTRKPEPLYSEVVNAADGILKAYTKFNSIEPWDAPSGGGDLPRLNKAFGEAVGRYLAHLEIVSSVGHDAEKFRRYKLAVQETTKFNTRTDLQIFDLAGRVGPSFESSGAYSDLYFSVIDCVIRDTYRFKALGAYGDFQIS